MSLPQIFVLSDGYCNLFFSLLSLFFCSQEKKETRNVHAWQTHEKNLVLLYLEQLFNKIPKFFTMV